MKIKKAFLIVLSLIMVFTFVFPLASFATESSNDENTESGFKDVPKTHWAFNAIAWMLTNKIAEGTGNGRFSPDKAVARDEFAKMMVLTLKLKLINPEVSSFEDIAKGSWQFKYVETAKPYLTIYRTDSGQLYYHPSEPSMREDMAVALVKALGFSKETVDESILDSFDDEDEISEKLRKYVAIAVKHKIMQGYTEDGKKLFGAQETLDRAQAAVLLYNAFRQNEEKITLEEEKDVFDDSQDTIPADESGYTIPVVRAVNANGKIIVSWDKINDDDFSGYKVVASKINSEPAYPTDGYFQYITDRNTTYTVIQNGDSYNGGDIGSRFKAGDSYYFSVTALYGDKKVTGNAVRMEMPEYVDEENHEYAVPVVRAEAVDGKIIVRWNEISDSRFSYYKIVVSKENSQPAYPGDGYHSCITDNNTTYCYLRSGDGYNGGDFGGKLKAGEKYYFSVTAVYGDVKKAGNAVRLVMP